jgi:hypothetical protein
MTRRVYGSLTRISDLATAAYDLQRIDRSHWATGDYIEAEVIPPISKLYHVEDQTGFMDPVKPGDHLVGALGHRAATLEGAGSWKAVDDDRLHALTNAGLLGRFTSFSPLLPDPISLRYLGHAARCGEKLTMRQFALRDDGDEPVPPTILMVGTSMSAGKTLTGRAAIEVLTGEGYDVTGVKLTGAGRYRDILSFSKSGAVNIYDFVDAGLPSTIVAEPDYRDAVRPLLQRIAGDRPDFLVCEAGASPMEPYNGAAAINLLGDSIACTILCATDPYAVVGVKHAFGLEPDLVTGPATNTSAAIDLVRKLTGLHGINIIDPDAMPEFRSYLLGILGLPAS